MNSAARLIYPGGRLVVRPHECMLFIAVLPQVHLFLWPSFYAQVMCRLQVGVGC